MTPLMLPAAPKDVGRLSDVLVSALASIDGGGENRLKLPKVKHSVVILVDGLGYQNLRNVPAYARFLNQNLNQSIRCEFPSTTATSIGGFATGVRSAKHGLIGYAAYDRALKVSKNLLTGWQSEAKAREFKIVPSLSELAVNVDVYSIGPKAYAASGFTELTMKAANYVPAESIAERLDECSKKIRGSRSSLNYVYVPELDQCAHKFGVQSVQWLNALEELDQLVSQFASKLPENVGVLLTADHGVVDVPQENHVYLDEYEWYAGSVEFTAGDPRCNYVYLTNPSESKTFLLETQEKLGHSAYVCTVDSLVKAGWVGVFSEDSGKLLPDVFIIWNDLAVAYDRRFAKPNHLKMIGQHGGISDSETRVPLIRLGKY